MMFAFAEDLDCRFVSKQGYNNVPRVGRILLAHDDIIARENTRANHAVPFDVEGEIRPVVCSQRAEGKGAFEVLHRQER